MFTRAAHDYLQYNALKNLLKTTLLEESFSYTKNMYFTIQKTLLLYPINRSVNLNSN